MAKTVEGIEEPVLAKAQEILGTATTRDTVNAALREVVRRKIVAQFLSDMRSMEPAELEKTRAAAWQ